MDDGTQTVGIGHNSQVAEEPPLIYVLVRLFNSVIDPGTGSRERAVALPPGSCVADVIERLNISREENRSKTGIQQNQ